MTMNRSDNYKRELFRKGLDKAVSGLNAARLGVSAVLCCIMAYTAFTKGGEFAGALTSAESSPPELRLMMGAFCAALYGAAVLLALNALVSVISILAIKEPGIGDSFIGRSALAASVLAGEVYRCIFSLAFIIFGGVGVYAVIKERGADSFAVVPGIFAAAGIAMLIHGIYRMIVTVKEWTGTESAVTDYSQNNSPDGF